MCSPFQRSLENVRLKSSSQSINSATVIVQIAGWTCHSHSQVSFNIDFHSQSLTIWSRYVWRNPLTGYYWRQLTPVSQVLFTSPLRVYQFDDSNGQDKRWHGCFRSVIVIFAWQRKASLVTQGFPMRTLPRGHVQATLDESTSSHRDNVFHVWCWQTSLQIACPLLWKIPCGPDKCRRNNLTKLPSLIFFFSLCHIYLYRHLPSRHEQTEATLMTLDTRITEYTKTLIYTTTNESIELAITLSTRQMFSAVTINTVQRLKTMSLPRRLTINRLFSEDLYLSLKRLPG